MVIANYIFIVFLAILSGVILVVTGDFPTGSYSSGYGPGFYPKIIVYIIIGLTVLLVIQTLLKKDIRKVEMSLKQLKIPAALVGLIIVYSLILEHLGFVFTTLIILCTAMITLKTSKVRALLVSSIITTLIYVGFKILLRVPLPEGIFI
ncbi:tripartite tricarboxylate transporter TctB family protein [Fredinandcohnia sp. 179-A 10B2 NHS]|uniref:tripartite tricarboxylate transporter TctB family protein n=1 Tax=Fredinandcohnia sp. 179-A 10B2 NHS TaxID=3235176 RepID=UPI00399FCF99